MIDSAAPTSSPAAGALHGAATGNDKQGVGLDYNTFLQLLLAQLKNQDPLKPMESTEYIAQLASLSNVEQQMAQNAKLDELLVSSALAQADGLVGKLVTSVDGSVSGTVQAVRVLSGGAIAELSNGQTIALGPGVIVSDS